jgi:hypothetical protein
VDDNLIVAQGEEYYQSYLTVLSTKFDYTEGPLTSHLGVAYHIDTEKGEISIEQSAQIMKFRKEFNYENCTPASAPAR